METFESEGKYYSNQSIIGRHVKWSYRQKGDIIRVDDDGLQESSLVWLSELFWLLYQEQRRITQVVQCLIKNRFKSKEKESIRHIDTIAMNGTVPHQTTMFGAIIKVPSALCNSRLLLFLIDWSYEEVASYGSLVGPRPVKTFVMNMTSQNWLTTEEVTRTEWYHDIIISIPKNIDPGN